MLAFTFPGQGSQRPGMGRPVGRPRELGTGRRGERSRRPRRRQAAARRRRRRAQGHPQRAAHDVRVEPDGARRRRAARHRRQLLRRAQPRRVHGARRHRRARVPGGRAARVASGRRRCTTPAPRSRARWRPCSGSTTIRSRSPATSPTPRCGSPTSTLPGQVVIAGSPRRRRGGRQARPRARRQEGDGAPGVRRVPHLVHGRRPRPAARRDRRRRHPRRRDPGGFERRRQAPRSRRRVDVAAVGPARQPGALEAVPADARRRSASPSSPSSAPAAC